jgi:hypothetical protein
MTPKRIQISPEKGWKMPPDTINISRPSKWGNPWRRRMSPDEALNKYRLWLSGDVRCFWLAGPPPPVKELRGKNVACRCGPHDKCHGDIILEFLCVPDPMNRETIME